MKRTTSKFIFEFIVVFLGIILAYQLSDFTEERKLRKVERVLLTDISSDLEADINDLTRMKEFNERKQAWLQEMIKLISSNSGSLTDSIALEASSLGSFYFFESSKFTFLAIRESGDIDLVKNTDIRRQIVKYYDRINALDRITEKLSNVMLESYYPQYIKHYDRIDEKVINREFFKSAELKNYFGLVLSEIKNQQFYINSIEKNGKELDSKIHSYLKSKD